MGMKYVVFRAFTEKGQIYDSKYECIIKNDDIWYLEFIEMCIALTSSDDSIIRVEKFYK